MILKLDPLAIDDDYNYTMPRRRNRRSADVSNQNFLCGQCDRGYTRIENLMRHQRLECGKEPKRYELKNHNEAKHSRLNQEIVEPEELFSTFMFILSTRNFQILMYALEEISDLLRDISKCQKATKTALTNVSSAQIIVKPDDVKPAVTNDINLPAACDFGFADKYSIDLPMKELAEFHEFEDMLKNDEAMRKDFSAVLPSLVDRHNIASKSTTNILRKFFTRAVVLKFTVQKKISDKIVLKDTCFCKCTIEVLIKMHKDNQGNPITEKDVYSAFGSSLNNAKDWDGYRSQRKEKEKKVVTLN
ncbi:hypothetical protein TSAR_011803 [Trichomalopsis sarcophagae]|uniref:C2H2-type domain-containing protein n=1 Tax=Trichomalopsis sarcophagae TaxID=543379 RepID=A0A232F619_9HYME|nr:hypothetical protein TSAR_011803 [Trichomalopsis sarcophagae]